MTIADQAFEVWDYNRRHPQVTQRELAQAFGMTLAHLGKLMFVMRNLKGEIVKDWRKNNSHIPLAAMQACALRRLHEQSSCYEKLVAENPKG